MSKGRILIVDDEKHLRRILKRLLNDEGYTVDIASTGTAAVARVKENGYDLAITDLRLPGMSGQETIRRVEEINPGIKFIIISGYQLDPEMEAKIRQGVYSFFEKPFVNKEVIAEVKRLIG